MAQEPIQVISIPELNNERGEARMELSTRKYDNGQILSAVHVHFLKDLMRTFEIYGDFRKTVLRTNNRATQKALDKQYAQAFTPEVIDALKAEALAFYVNKRKK